VDFFARFLRIGLAHLEPDPAIYQWQATRRQALVEEAWKQVGLPVHRGSAAPTNLPSASPLPNAV
jgi:hypothetical protein